MNNVNKATVLDLLNFRFAEIYYQDIQRRAGELAIHPMVHGSACISYAMDVEKIRIAKSLVNAYHQDGAITPATIERIEEQVASNLLSMQRRLAMEMSSEAIKELVATIAQSHATVVVGFLNQIEEDK